MGRWLLKNGEWQTLDVKEICATAEAMAQELVTQASELKCEKGRGLMAASFFRLDFNQSLMLLLPKSCEVIPYFSSPTPELIRNSMEYPGNIRAV